MFQTQLHFHRDSNIPKRFFPITSLHIWAQQQTQTASNICSYLHDVIYIMIHHKKIKPHAQISAQYSRSSSTPALPLVPKGVTHISSPSSLAKKKVYKLKEYSIIRSTFLVLHQYYCTAVSNCVHMFVYTHTQILPKKIWFVPPGFSFPLLCYFLWAVGTHCLRPNGTCWKQTEQTRKVIYTGHTDILI